MMAYSHLAVGAAAWTALGPRASTTEWLAGLGVCLLGSLLPDIDHPGSWIGRRLWFISLPVSAAFGHRSITHSCSAAIAVLLATVFLPSGLPGLLTLALAIGYLSHLLADSFTKPGIPLLWPDKTRYCFPLVSFKTGDSVELLITACGFLCMFLGMASLVHPIR